MHINKTLGGLFLLSNLVFISPVFAGGGPVEFTVDPNQSLNPGEQYIVHALVYANGPYPTYCKSCFIKLALQNPQDGDYIVQNDNVTNDDGRIYAKVISKVPGNRTIYVSELRGADSARITANSTVILNYIGEFLLPSPTPSPTPSSLPQPEIILPPEGSIYVKVGTQRYIDGPKRMVYLSWNQIKNAVKYNVYIRLTDIKDYGAAIEGTGSFSTEIGINAFLDYYVKVDACSSAGCISSSEIFVPRMKKEEGGAIVVPSPSTVTTAPSIKPSTPNNSNIDELNKKVENLQSQLEESKQKQNFLESRLNQLISWIKSVFPFFK